MNLEELRSVQDAERRKSDLQPLRESFYEEAGEYIADLKAERERVADRAEDPFSSSEVRQITDEIETAEDVLDSIYERRMGKLLKRASLAAAEMTVEEEGLTAEEQELFDDLVDRITTNKDRVLKTLAGDPDPVGDAGADGPDGSAAAGPGNDPAVETPSRGAHADGTVDPQSREGTDDDRSQEPIREEPTVENGASEADVGDAAGDTGRHEIDPEPAPENRGANGSDDDSVGTNGTDRVTVRITDDVGAIYGVDDREYDLSSEDVVALPEANADPLVERGAAEPIDPA